MCLIKLCECFCLDCVFAYDANFFFHVTCSCITLRYFLLSRALFSTVFLYFFSLSLSLSLNLVSFLWNLKSMFPPRTQTNVMVLLLLPLFLIFVRFCDEKTRNDFYENFSDWTIHSKCKVILSNFSDTFLPSAFSSRG